jgi:uncharacterized protein with von Willebrand factor type A (vWA) domain
MSDLSELLAEQPNQDSELEISGAEEYGHKPKKVSDTALELDSWALRRGAEVLEGSDRIKQLFGYDPENPDESKPVGTMKERELAVADFHGAAFEPEPKLAQSCKNDRIRRYMENLMQTPEFKALHNETQLDETASEIAAASFAEQWVELVKTEEPKEDFKKDMQCLGAAAKALKGAAGDVSDLRDAQCALGLGGNGGGNGSLNSQQLAGMFKRVRGSHSLKRICELAGRYRRFAQAQQRKKVLHGRDDVVGVVLDGDPGRLLPSELALLDDEDLELDIYRRIVERVAMCRDYRGVESKARGPIVVVVDESGSMHGEPIYTAKAMALALAWVARTQKRYCALVGFSGGTEGNFLVIPPTQSRHDELMSWLEHFYDGGTDCDIPLVELPSRWEEMGCPKGKTDIVMITDAIIDIPDGVRESFLAWKAREQVKLISLILGGAPGDMSLVSDRVHCVRSLSLEESAVAEALSV